MFYKRLQLFLSICLSCSALNLAAQDWKQVYNEALTLYQEQNYEEALSKANRAYTLSKSLDLKNQAYTLQLLTSICMESNRNEEGLSVINEEENLFKKIEGPGSMTYAEALRKHSLMLLQKGTYAGALEKCRAAMDILQSNQQEKSLTYATLLAEEGQLLALLGDLTQAKKILDQSLVKLATFPEAGEDFLNVLTAAAGVDKKMKDFPSAEKKYKKILGVLEQNGLQKTAPYGEAQTALAEILLLQSNTTESANANQNESVGAELKASQFLKIAVDYHNHRLLDKALEAYQSAEKAAVDGKLENNTAFSIYLNYGKARLEMNELTAAASQFQQASLLCNKLYPAGAPEYVLMDFVWGDLNMAQDRISPAVELYMKAAKEAGNLPPFTRKQLALKTAAQLLNAYQSEGAVNFLLLLDAGEVNAKSVLEQPELIAIYSEALLRSNQLINSQSLLQKALTFSGEGPVRTNFELDLIQVLERKGELPRALALLIDMQRKPSLGEDQKLEVMYQKARIQQLMGQYQEAEKGYRNVISILSKKRDYQDQLQMQCYNSLAVLQTQLGNYDEAERLYTDLLKNKDLPVDFIFTVRQNLATIYEESLQMEKARVILEQVVTDERQREGESPELAITLQNLATLYQKTGNLTSAKQLLDEAIRIDQATVGDQSASFATKLANLGVVQQQLGNLVEARKLFQQALKIHEKTLGKEHPDYMFNAYNLAVSLQQSKESTAAAPLFKEVSGFYRKQIQELFPAMSEREKASFYNKINEIILAYLDFAIENSRKFPALKGELYDFRLITKALLYNSSVKIRNTILSSGDTLILARFTEWQKTKEDLGKLSQLSAPEKIQVEDQIQRLRHRADELEKLLAEKSASFYTETQQTSVDWKKVKSRLQKGQAAIEMIRLRLNLKNDSVIYAALVLRPELESPELVVFPNGKEMEGRDFYYYRNSIKYQIHNDRSYRVYWKPLEEKLSGVHTVFLSPDGVYNKINLMTLLDPKSNKYLLETMKVKLVNNTRELLTPPRNSSTQMNAALFGRPDFEGGSNVNTTVSSNRSPSDLESLVMNGITDLPGTEEEVNKIGLLLREQKWETITYLGEKTTETAIKQQKDPRLLHIATHGFFIPVETGKDPIMLVPDIRQPAKNPLLRSGLILSGAQRFMQLDKSKRNFSEDGILTAYEVMNLNLDKTELVILSACETGAGEIKNGEGIFGLQRAFLLAGAGTIVMSLWKVDDAATQELMVEFYRQWIITNDKYEAFHKTMLMMKTKLNEPYYWGGFAMIGIN